MNPTDTAVVHCAAAERFELRVAEEVAFTAYSLVGRSLFLAYTEVPAPLAERGAGTILLRGVFEYARSRGLTVVPICPAVRSFVEQEPEFRDLVRERDR